MKAYILKNTRTGKYASTGYTGFWTENTVNIKVWSKKGVLKSWITRTYGKSDSQKNKAAQELVVLEVEFAEKDAMPLWEFDERYWGHADARTIVKRMEKGTDD